VSENKGSLITMITRERWKTSTFARSKDRKFVEDVVLDKDFWKSIKVIRMVDSYEKPAMEFIYEAIDEANEKKQKEFNVVKMRYLIIHVYNQILTLVFKLHTNSIYSII